MTWNTKLIRWTGVWAYSISQCSKWPPELCVGMFLGTIIRGGGLCGIGPTVQLQWLSCEPVIDKQRRSRFSMKVTVLHYRPQGTTQIHKIQGYMHYICGVVYTEDDAYDSWFTYLARERKRVSCQLFWSHWEYNYNRFEHRRCFCLWSRQK